MTDSSMRIEGRSTRHEGSFDASGRSAALICMCVMTAGVGIITATFGPLLPELAPRNGLPLHQAGVIISLLFLAPYFRPWQLAP